MSALDDLTGAVQEAFTINFSNISVWVTYFLYAFFIVAVLLAVWTLVKYRVKVTYFPVLGDPNDLKSQTIGRPRKDFGAYVKDRKGNEYFSLLLARKKLAPVPYSKKYQDGVFFLRKSNSEFEVIPRPVIGNPSVTLNVLDPAMDLWAHVQKQQIALRTVDEDVSKRNMVMTTVVAIGCLVFVGVIIWFIMGMASQTVTESVSKADQLINAIQGFATSGAGAPG